MAEFISFEAEAEDDDEEDEFVSDDNNVNDDNDYDEPFESLYMFENVTRNTQDAINETLSYAFDSREANNYCCEDFDITSEQIKEFHDSQTKVDEFKKLCFFHIYYCHLMHFITQLFLLSEILKWDSQLPKKFASMIVLQK